MYCPACGRGNPAEALHCGACGRSLKIPSDGGGVAVLTKVQEPNGQSADSPPPPSPRGGNRPRVIAAALVMVVLLAAGVGYRLWSQSQSEAAYVRGVVAIAERNWDVAVSSLQAAGDYLDAKKQLEEATRQFGQVLRYYSSGNESASRGAWWDAAYNLRRALDIQPKYRDAEARLAEARKHIGSLLYYYSSGQGSSTLWLAPADGGGARDLITGSTVEAYASDGGGFLVRQSQAQGASVFYFSADGATRQRLWDARSASVWDDEQGKLALVAVSEQQSPTDQWVYHVVNLETGRARELFRGTDGVQSFAPDLSFILFRRSDRGQTVFTLRDTATGSTKEVARASNVSNATISPDGGRVLIVIQERDSQGRDRQTARLYDVASGRQQELGSGRQASGRFSPDGQYLLLWQQGFDRNVGTLSVVNVLAGETQQVADGVGAVQQTVWMLADNTPAAQQSTPTTASPAGPKAAVVALDALPGQASRSTVFLVDPVSAKARSLSAGLQTASVSYDKAAGRLMLFLRYVGQERGTLSIVDPTSVDLSGSYVSYSPRELASAESAWGYFSPNGKQIAIVTNDYSRVADRRSSLLAASVDDGAPVQVVTGASIGSLQFSPDGTKVAFSFGQSSSSSQAIFVADLSPKTPVRVLEGNQLEGWREPAGMPAEDRLYSSPYGR